MRLSRVVTFAAALAAVTASAGVVAPAALSAVTPQTIHFAVRTGARDGTGTQVCDIVADLYTPPGATVANPAPAILTTNGFGGSKDGQAPMAQAYAAQGYVVLSYSGLGFGGSGCKITLDDREHDGTAGSQLVDFLGGKAGNAFADAAHTTPIAPPDVVRRDDLEGRPGSDGQLHANDPRVGMIGGSYGGQIQFAVAAVDPRVDTIIPLITWNDLSYSLAPNNTSLPPGSVSATAPGTQKVGWTSLFFGLGIVSGLQGTQADPKRNVGCPNFADQACAAKAQMDALGYPTDSTTAFARNASVATYIDDIRIPVLLGQGQADTLFNLQESAATYRQLRDRGVPVKLIWKKGGHSGGAAPGEESLGGFSTYLARVYKAWFDHHLADRGPAPIYDVSWFRDWVEYEGDAEPAYASAPTLEDATVPETLYLSGADALVRDRTKVVGGASRFVVPAAGAPTSYTETSALDQTQPVRDTPSTFAAFSTPALDHDVDLVGSPTAELHLDTPGHSVGQRGGPGGQLVLFVKLYDVAPDGSITLPHRLISPVRVPDVTTPLRVELPGIVHRVKAGHTLRLVVAAGDLAYKGNNVAGPVSITTDPANPGTLTLPVAAVDPGTPVVPEAPAALLPLAALVLAAAATLGLRRRAGGQR